MTTILTDGGAVAALSAFFGFRERGIMSLAEFDQFLDEAPVFFRAEVNGPETFGASNEIAPVKPTKRLTNLLAALSAREAEMNSRGGRRVLDVDREHASHVSSSNEGNVEPSA
jgi:hypothetical protein